MLNISDRAQDLAQQLQKWETGSQQVMLMPCLHYNFYIYGMESAGLVKILICICL